MLKTGKMRRRNIPPLRHKPINPEKFSLFVTCGICGKRRRCLTNHLMLHHVSPAEYREMFPDHWFLSDYSRYQLSERTQKSHSSNNSYSPLSKKEILRKLKLLAGQGLSSSEQMRNHDPALYGQVLHAFGSWRAACKRVGLKPPSDSFWTKDKVIKRIRERARVGLPLGYSEVFRDEPSLAMAGGPHFGNWGNAIRASGLRYEDHRLIADRWDRAKVIQHLNRYCRANGGLNQKEMRAKDKHLYYKVHHLFGSVNRAAIKLGLPVRRFNRKWSRDAVLQELAKLKSIGSTLARKELVIKHSPLLQACIYYYGTRRAAVAAQERAEKTCARRKGARK